MKKLATTLLTTLTLVSVMSTSVLAFASGRDTVNPMTGKKPSNSVVTVNTETQYGRLTIESAGINVALYNSNTQATCDAPDSACFYHFNGISGMTIADHNYQGFRALLQLQAGTTGYITEENGGIIYIECVEATNGRNEGSSLVYDDGTIATGRSDYLTYTCIDFNGNIRICQWNIVSTENIDAAYERQFNIDSRTINNILSHLVIDVSLDEPEATQPEMPQQPAEEPVEVTETTDIEMPVEETQIEETEQTTEENQEAEPQPEVPEARNSGNNGNHYGQNNGNNGNNGNHNGANRGNGRNK